MPVYQYKGVNEEGKWVKGILDVEHKGAVGQVLKSRGIFVTEVREAGGGGVRNGQIEVGKMFQRVGLRDVAVMTRQLATLLRAGISLVEALNALSEQAEKGELKRVLSDVRRQVNEGSALAKAMAEHPKIFNHLYVNMVKAGESSGNLDVVLVRLTEFLENQMELRSKVIGALVYPILMSVVGVAILGFLFAFVIPKVTKIFEDQDRALPFITQVLLVISDVVSAAWFILIPLILGSVYGFFWWKKSPKGKPVWDRLLLKMPVVSNLVRMIAVARFAKTLGTLLRSGVPLLQALDIVKNILGNTRLVEVIEDVRVNVREGDSIAQPLKRSGEFPSLVVHMIAIGERTGQLEEMLDNVAISYNQQVDLRIDAATTLLEPLMIVVMGAVVAFIVFAVMLPILQMNQSFG